jgi:cyclase
MNIRIIPRLDIKGPNLVKGIQLEGIRVLGKPEEFAFWYYLNGADELLYIDVVASLYGRNSLSEIVQRTSKDIFIPLTVGGGLRSLDDIRGALKSGADKVALNTAAIRNPDLIEEASRRFGSSTIVVSIEAKKMVDGSYEAYIDNGRERTGLDVFEWSQRATELGAGEILITSIDREGTGKGFDLDLIRQIAENVSIPVIACGGAGTRDHVLNVITRGKADAVCIASMFHYDLINPSSDDGDLKKGFMRSNIKAPKHIKGTSIASLKKYLIDEKISCRPIDQDDLYGG